MLYTNLVYIVCARLINQPIYLPGSGEWHTGRRPDSRVRVTEALLSTLTRTLK